MAAPDCDKSRPVDKIVMISERNLPAAGMFGDPRDAKECRSYIICVDLCPLERPGEIEIAHLGLRIELVDLPATLAVSVAGLLYSAERQMGLGADRWRVDVGDAIVELIEGAHGDIHVACVDRRGQAVAHVVVDRERLVDRPKAHDRQPRTENLFLLESRARLDARENRRLEKPAVRQSVTLGAR